MDVPQYMEKGSHGPAVDLVLKYLAFLAKIRGVGDQTLPKIEIDGDYGNAGVAHMERLQRDLGLEPDGGFGPETRDRLKEVTGTDFEAACLNLEDDLETFFMQPDGKVIRWKPSDFV
jgi:hypothetical protein